MKASGVIKQFSTLVNLTALDYYWYAYALRMQRFDNEDAAKLKAFAQHHPFLIRAVKTLGDWDFLLYIAADNRKNFHGVVKEIKRLFAHNLKKYDTWVGYKEHYFNPFPSALKKKAP
jgi:DNA-binding Lrp family transcriptional regulator